MSHDPTSRNVFCSKPALGPQICHSSNTAAGISTATGPLVRTPKAIHKAVRRKALRSCVDTYRHKSSADNINHKPSSASAVAVRAMAQGPKLLANTMAANIPARGPQALLAVKASAIHASHADSAEGSRKANSFSPKSETLRACNQ